jgi:hypothetical protein
MSGKCDVHAEGTGKEVLRPSDATMIQTKQQFILSREIMTKSWEALRPVLHQA